MLGVKKNGWGFDQSLEENGGICLKNTSIGHNEKNTLLFGIIWSLGTNLQRNIHQNLPPNKWWNLRQLEPLIRDALKKQRPIRFA